MNDLENITLKIYDFYFMPETFKELKIRHYKTVFEEHYEEVYKKSNSLGPKEKTFILAKGNNLIARCVAEFNKYDIRIREFTVLKNFRGEGIASKFINLIEEQALQHHHNFLKNKKKSYDIMFLRTYIYLDGDFHDEKFEMSHFLKKISFKPYKYNPQALSKEEEKALKAYTQINPQYPKKLRIFKKSLRDNLVLKPKIKKELLRTDEKQKEIVLKGLDIKLDVYDKRGFVSYKYNVCPVCNDMKSSLEDNSSCEKCYINKTCLEPFKDGFKDDNQISYKYFSAIRKFLREMKKPLNMGAV